MIDQSSMLCAHCQRCGRRSVLGRVDAASLAPPADGEAPPRLRCDMCGGRQVKLFNANGPVEMLAFLNGRI
ncbi:hypothetical protein [Ancylobacter rudongensis]|jgi:hypothetical protein|uniref:Uncharacterized protein n=1 Tax=Ancylobacter rudongensis TaxID=177413 RepID=A0A1G4PVZ2_9HYPH|nr:hypothetical protein [Ancylobacter rudongensis]SCW36331.1 hypothetical protein SAMN05660859_0803 [Ancylobacter rudongensis]